MRILVRGGVLIACLFPLLVKPSAADDRSDCTGPHPDSPAKIAACTRAIDSGRFRGRDLAVLRLYRSAALRRTGDPDRALADANEVVRLEPNLAVGYNERGQVHADKTDHARAIVDFGEALRRDPKLFLALYRRGISHAATSADEKAIADFNAALAINPNDAPTFFQRGEVYRKRRDLDRAIADYSETIRIDPRVAAAHNNRGLCLSDLREYDRALADLDQALRLDPNFAAAYNNRGRLLTAIKQFDRALTDLNEAVRLAPGNPAPYRNRAFLHENRGDRASALADWNRAAQLEPGSRDPQKAIERIQRETSPAAPKRRVALVIGNAAYRVAGRLANPGNDASDVAALLRRLDFDVTEGLDLGRTEMEQKIAAFSSKLAGADLGLFFYAGHGVQVDGRNFLVPVDARVQKPADLASQTIDVGRVIAGMEAEQRANLIFLDACRDNPLGQGSPGARAIERGLAPIQNAIGTLTAFATKPHHVALDGTGRNSPFTTALLKHAATPGLEIGAVLKRVRADVFQATGGRQIPFDESSLVTDVVLVR